MKCNFSEMNIKNAIGIFGISALLQFQVFANNLKLDDFVHYWQEFESHEKKLQDNAEQDFNEVMASIDDAVRSLKEEKKRYTIVSLRQAVESYRNQLESNRSTQSRPYLLLNFAQVLTELSNELKKTSFEAGNPQLFEAIRVLSEFPRNYSTHPLYAEALFLHAAVLRKLGRTDESIRKLKNVVRLKVISEKKIFLVLSNLILGDNEFKKENSAKAFKYYSDASENILEPKDKTHLLIYLKVHYRLAWAGYRTGNFNTLLKSCEKIISNVNKTADQNNIEKMLYDAARLVAEALYQLDDQVQIARIIDNAKFADSRPEILFQLMQVVYSDGQYRKAIKIAGQVRDKFPFYKKMPDLLGVQADSHSKLNQSFSSIKTKEALAQLGSKNSLWRIKNTKNDSALNRGIDLSREAAIFVAAHYYRKGLASREKSYFNRAKFYYETLIKAHPESSLMTEWKLRTSHSSFFSEQYDDSVKGYKELVGKNPLPSKELQIAKYQIVRAKEELWKEKFRELSEKGENPTQNQLVNLALEDLVSATQDYVNHVGDSRKSAEVLLIGANALRDMRQYEKAIQVWKQTLLTTISPDLRIYSIRGTLFSIEKLASPKRYVDTASRFLELEDWQKLGRSFRKELMISFSKGLDRLIAKFRSEQKFEEIGSILVANAKRYRDLHKRQDFLRQGAYLLALGGAWNKAEDATRFFLKSDFNKNRGDVAYLLGKSLEQMLDFQNAAIAYYDYAKKHLGHSRAKKGLEKAKYLAKSEQMWDLVADASVLLAKNTRNVSVSQTHFHDAADAKLANDNYESALNILNQAISSTKSIEWLIKSRLKKANILFLQNNYGAALDLLRELATAARNNRVRLGGKMASRLEANARYLQASHHLKRFKEMDIFATGTLMINAVENKIQLFELLSNQFNLAVQTKDGVFAPMARIQLAKAARELANDLISYTTGSTTLEIRAKNQYRSHAERLKRLSRSLISANLNEKSSNKLSRNEAINFSRLIHNQRTFHKQYTLPNPSYDILPKAWSH